MLKMLEEAFAESKHWNDLSYEEKNERLFQEQKKVLDMFLVTKTATVLFLRVWQ